MTSARIIKTLSEASQVANEASRLAHGIGVNLAIVSEAVAHLTPYFPILNMVPLLKDFLPLLESVSFIGEISGGLKLINVICLLHKKYTGNISPHSTINVDIASGFLSGGILVGLSCKGFLSSSLALTQLGWAISSFIDLLQCTYRFYRVYQIEGVDPQTYRETLLDCFISLVKCVGWSFLAFGGLGSIAIAVGWTLLGLASLVQLSRSSYDLGSKTVQVVSKKCATFSSTIPASSQSEPASYYTNDSQPPSPSLKKAFDDNINIPPPLKIDTKGYTDESIPLSPRVPKHPFVSLSTGPLM